MDRRRFLGGVSLAAASAVVPPARPAPAGAFAWRRIEGVDDLPEPGRYVLILYNGGNWHDRDDPRGAYIKTAKLLRGITEAEREQMRRGEIPAPDLTETWCLSQGIRMRERWELYRSEDGLDRAWCWEEFGPGRFSAHSVDWWAPIPELPEEAA